jgi:hypothetical protein
MSAPSQMFGLSQNTSCFCPGGISFPHDAQRVTVMPSRNGKWWARERRSVWPVHVAPVKALPSIRRGRYSPAAVKPLRWPTARGCGSSFLGAESECASTPRRVVSQDCVAGSGPRPGGQRYGRGPHLGPCHQMSIWRIVPITRGSREACDTAEKTRISLPYTCLVKCCFVTMKNGGRNGQKGGRKGYGNRKKSRSQNP